MKKIIFGLFFVAVCLLQTNYSYASPDDDDGGSTSSGSGYSGGGHSGGSGHDSGGSTGSGSSSGSGSGSGSSGSSSGSGSSGSGSSGSSSGSGSGSSGSSASSGSSSDLYYCNAYGGSTRTYPSGLDADGDDRAFIVELDGVSRKACIDLLSQDWAGNIGEGFIGLAVNRSANDLYRTSCQSSAGVACAKDGNMSLIDASNVCQETNMLSLKFH